MLCVIYRCRQEGYYRLQGELRDVLAYEFPRTHPDWPLQEQEGCQGPEAQQEMLAYKCRAQGEAEGLWDLLRFPHSSHLQGRVAHSLESLEDTHEPGFPDQAAHSLESLEDTHGPDFLDQVVYSLESLEDTHVLDSPDQVAHSRRVALQPDSPSENTQPPVQWCACMYQSQERCHHFAGQTRWEPPERSQGHHRCSQSSDYYRKQNHRHRLPAG